ncbi:MAG: tetratricopeptide repeat protein [Bacteroidota bacterium]|nr:tetratricopeptide repeat protein [Bacteroidota bacterium]
MAKQTAISNKRKGSSSIISFLYKRKVQVALLLAFTGICYFNILFNEFSLDDEFITENVFVQKGFSGIKDIWTHPYWQIKNDNIDYRPLTLSLLAIEYSFFGHNAFVDHLMSLISYLLCVWLLYLVCIYVFEINKGHPLSAFFIVLLYAVHPSHTEVVASFKNIDEILSFIWVLLAVLCLDKSFKSRDKIRTGIFIIMTVLLFYFSMLTKLVSVPFMACIFLWLLYKKYYLKKIRFIVLLVTVIAVICLHLYVFKTFLLQRATYFYENPIVGLKDIAMKLGVVFNTILFYLRFMIVPYPFRFYYGYNTIALESISNPLPLLSMMISLALVALLIYSIIKRASYSYFLFSFLFFLLFYCNLFKLYTGIVSERAMFQFSFFFIAFIILAIRNVIQRAPGNNFFQKISLSVYVLFICAFTLLTINRNRNWKNTETLILHDIKSLDNSTGGVLLAANFFYFNAIKLQTSDTEKSRQWIDLAIHYYNRALQLSPEYVITNYRLGMAYRYGKLDFNNAAINYMIAKEQSPMIEGLAKEIASLFFLQKKFQEAIPYYEKAVKEEPGNSELLFYRALNRFNAKDIPGFLELNKVLLQNFPETQYPYLNYGTYYFNQNNEAKVVENFATAVKYGCSSRQVLDYLAKYYLKNNDPAKEKYYEDLQQRR